MKAPARWRALARQSRLALDMVRAEQASERARHQRELDTLRAELDAARLERDVLLHERDARAALAKAAGAALVSTARDVLARDFDRLLAEARKGGR